MMRAEDGKADEMSAGYRSLVNGLYRKLEVPIFLLRLVACPIFTRDILKNEAPAREQTSRHSHRYLERQSRPVRRLIGSASGPKRATRGRLLGLLRPLTIAQSHTSEGWKTAAGFR